MSDASSSDHEPKRQSGAGRRESPPPDAGPAPSTITALQALLGLQGIASAGCCLYMILIGSPLAGIAIDPASEQAEAAVITVSLGLAAGLSFLAAWLLAKKSSRMVLVLVASMLTMICGSGALIGWSGGAFPLLWLLPGGLLIQVMLALSPQSLRWFRS